MFIFLFHLNHSKKRDSAQFSREFLFDMKLFNGIKKLGFSILVANQTLNEIFVLIIITCIFILYCQVITLININIDNPITFHINRSVEIF